MTNANDPAIPGIVKDRSNSTLRDIDCTAGLTKREYFASIAMSGLLCNAAIITGTKQTVSIQALSESATHYADALINELNKTINDVTDK